VVDPDSENDETEQNRLQGSSARQREIEQSTNQEGQPRDPKLEEEEEQRNRWERNAANR
jgi:hypothetical protein